MSKSAVLVIFLNKYKNALNFFFKFSKLPLRKVRNISHGGEVGGGRALEGS